MKKVLFTFMLLFMGTAVFAQIPVTFQVDMGVQVFKGTFIPGTDKLVARGGFQTDAGDAGGDWQGAMFELTDTDGDTIYTVVANMPTAKAGTVYPYKFVIINSAGDQWEGNVGDGKADREFTLTGPAQEIPVVWFNNDSVYPTVTITNTINFTADISNILGIGSGGAFDPAQDSILVMGLDWDGLGEKVVGNRRMEQDPFNPGLFRTTLSVNKITSDSTKWKFKAYPDARFSNTGWEDGSDNWYYYGPDGTTVDITAVPRINPVLAPITADVEFNFHVDVTNAKNQYNDEVIDPASIEFVGLRGGADWLGSWASGGNWLVTDTTTGNMKVLNDDGVNGDVTANDNIWSIKIIVPAGTVGGSFEYKYAAYYPGADTINGGSSPLDNEGGFGRNHKLILKDGGPFTIENQFGVFTTAIERLDDVIPQNFSLEQNYPNPFNPSTKIRYSVPNEGLVNIKVYNLVGELMGELVNEQHKSGTYEVSFDASQFSSGVYFYTITSGDFTATKKMLLMK